MIDELLDFLGLIKKSANRGINILNNNSVKLDDSKKQIFGTPIFCNLCGQFEHSGIMNSDRIIHLTGEGKVEETTPEDFVKRMNKFNGNPPIFVPLNTNYKILHSKKIKNVSILQLGRKPSKYNMMFENCHKFTLGCMDSSYLHKKSFVYTFNYLNDCIKQEFCEDIIYWLRLIY